mmetsp:Transcript_1927/g.5782  ORF Transcript_1927/g.5782 Transcript_1927/m.5782 type:complete len:272 (-) Transcript_1927:264-1079(-)|eukprot:CAMPEP_0198734886 /NCGR_PEP_ID=MMETSP1475-20131203/55739_1 /TAXON_ID= ORGANISM="Unidentified sp., Strain CCMP1999" /NCGR_SAMPLE_ID=MMETSP1475 /ASSEMBLY_ACC=CAM_ASM_001111 /LENGTH=271 /DNA_ID=CAMNT_0044498447 /DNA_START=177 /DNA_END=995 /DNA_ORIENTATION=-
MVGRVHLNEDWDVDGGDERGASKVYRRGGSLSKFRARAPLLTRLRASGYDVPFLILLAVIVVTGFFFVGIRKKGVELTIDQMAEYQRRVKSFSNTTLYISELDKTEGILNNLIAVDWAEVAKDVAFVAFIYGDLAEQASETWADEIVKALERSPIPGFGIVLFQCGCIVPNSYFEFFDVRFERAECLLLPGFIFPKEFVFWADVQLETSCRSRDAYLQQKVIAENREEIESTRERFAELAESVRRQLQDEKTRRKRNSVKQYKRLHSGIAR